MTWIDNNGEVRPQSWEEYLTMIDPVPEWAIVRKVYQPEPLHRPREDRSNKPSIRLRLFRANPYCFWCGVAVTLNTYQGHPQIATVDHLYSRLHPARKDKYRQQDGVLHVLACSACNHQRSVCEQRKIQFVPKLKERLEFAQLADATLAVREHKEQEVVEVPRSPMRVICTLEEAITFARENPAR